MRKAVYYYRYERKFQPNSERSLPKNMEIIKTASAGTMESSDVYVEIEPGSGIQINIESVVKGQFGDAIRQVVEEVLREQGVENACVNVADRGALDCVIRARVETAALRGKGE